MTAGGGACPECGSPAYRSEGSCSVCLAWGFSPYHRGDPRMCRSLSIAHTRGLRTGRKSTPFSPTLNVRVGLENRKKAQAGSTHSTLPGGLAERGRKSTPPFVTRARAKKGRGLNRLNRGGGI